MTDLSTIEKTRAGILNLEDALNEMPGVFHGDSENCPLKHTFAPGMYVREIRIPAGTVLTGKIHKHAHPNFLMSGTVEVVTESNGREILHGPLSMISPAGTKRALIAITDLVWITVHLNPKDTKDLNELEKEVISPSYEDYERFIQFKDNKFIKFISKISRNLLYGRK